MDADGVATGIPSETVSYIFRPGVRGAVSQIERAAARRGLRVDRRARISFDAGTPSPPAVTVFSDIERNGLSSIRQAFNLVDPNLLYEFSESQTRAHR